MAREEDLTFFASRVCRSSDGARPIAPAARPPRNPPRVLHSPPRGAGQRPRRERRGGRLRGRVGVRGVGILPGGESRRRRGRDGAVGGADARLLRAAGGGEGGDPPPRRQRARILRRRADEAAARLEGGARLRRDAVARLEPRRRRCGERQPDGFNQFPPASRLPAFRPAMHAYFDACTSLAERLTEISRSASGCRATTSPRASGCARRTRRTSG